MESLAARLPEIWLFLIGFLLLYYAVTDGANLGVGVLSLLARDEAERGAFIAAIKGTWHNGQTWLVLLGGMLFGAFPVFYAVILSALYVPLGVMLLGLIFRGVAIELRDHSERKRFWGRAFGLGSLLAALGQGAALGGLLGGTLEVEGTRFAGGLWDWISLYGLLVAAGLLLGYAMLGANSLILKTAGALQDRSYRRAWAASLATLAVTVSVHLWTALRFPKVAVKWGDPAALAVVSIFPALAALAFGLLLRSLRKRQERGPFAWNACLVLLSFAGLSVAFYPDMVPHVISATLTVHAAAASPKTLAFMLVVIALFLPLILGYTAYAQWVFRGKVEGAGYGE